MYVLSRMINYFQTRSKSTHISKFIHNKDKEQKILRKCKFFVCLLALNSKKKGGKNADNPILNKKGGFIASKENVVIGYSLGEIYAFISSPPNCMH